jgi:hypothetical protein
MYSLGLLVGLRPMWPCHLELPLWKRGLNDPWDNVGLRRWGESAGTVVSRQAFGGAMSATDRLIASGGSSLRQVGINGHSSADRPISSTSVIDHASEPSRCREVHIYADGSVVTATPVDEMFTGALSYGARLGVLVGDLLGLEKLHTVDMQFKNQRWAMMVTAAGEVVARQISGHDELKVFKARFGR